MLLDINIIISIFVKSLYKKYLLIGENNHNLRYPYKTFENYLISSLSLLVKSFEEATQPSDNHVNNARG